MTMLTRPLQPAARILMGMYVGAWGGVFIDRNMLEGEFAAMLVGASCMGLLGGLSYYLERRAPKCVIPVGAGILGTIMGLVWGDNAWIGIIFGAVWMAVTATIISGVAARWVLAGTAGVIVTFCILIITMPMMGVAPAMIVALTMVVGPLVGAAIQIVLSRQGSA